MKRGIYLMLAFMLMTNLIAQNSIKGNVIDDEGRPLIGAIVKIKGSAKGAYTDYLGNFLIDNVDNGVYMLEASFMGFKSLSKEVAINSSDAELGSLTLVKSGLELTEIMVEATRAAKTAPFAQTNIDYTDIEKSNLGQDLPFLLQNEISMVNTSDAGAGIGYSGFRLRGSDATRINVTVNGIPINDSESQGVYWVNMPDFASSTENIQIQRGVGTSTNGAGAFGGTVNLQTNDLKENPYGEISNSFGSFNSQKYTAKLGTGLINNRWAFDARASLIKSDGYIDRAASNLKSYYLSGGYYGDKTVLKLIHFAGRERTYQSWWGTPQSVIDGDSSSMLAHAGNNGLDSVQTANLLNAGRTYNYYQYDNEIDNYGQDHYQLHWSNVINEDLKSNIALHYTHGAGYYEQFRKGDDFSDYGMNDLIMGGDTISSTDLIRRRWLDNDFYGLTYNFLYDKSKLKMTLGGAYNVYDGDHFGEIIWTEYANGSSIRDKYYDNVGVKYDFNTYIKAEYTLSDALQTFIDIQYRKVDYSTAGVDNDLKVLNVDTSFTFLNPKLGLNYNISDKMRLFASIAVANREPVRNDFIDNPSNAQPSHESLMDYELGFDFANRKASFQANIFYMDYTNQLILTGELNDVGSSVRTNVDESFRAGLEMSTNVVLSDKLKFRWNATLSQNKIAEFKEVLYDYTNGYEIIENIYENTDIAFSPNIISAAGIEYAPLKSIQLLVQAKYVGKQYLDNTSNDNRAISAYQTLDARLSYSLLAKGMKELNLNLMVNNVLNALYSSNGYTYSYIYGDMITENFYYPQAGRNFLCGLTLKF